MTQSKDLTSMVSMADAPFHCPPDTVLDIPLPPSVNRTRRLDKAALPKVKAWKEAADKTIMASGQMRRAWRNMKRYELTIVLDEAQCNLDPDNPVKSAIDYLRRIEIITDDAPKNARRITIEWGDAPAGMRLIIRPLEDLGDWQSVGSAARKVMGRLR